MTALDADPDAGSEAGEVLRERPAPARGEAPLLVMPRLLGVGLAPARKMVDLAGIAPAGRVRARYVESEAPRGTVVEQDPRPGARVVARSEVTLDVADRNVVRYLPGIYQKEDHTGRNFLRDLVWPFQHVLNGIEDEVDRVHEVFDPFAARGELLSWLASWVALVLDEAWPEEKKRSLVSKAVELYRHRGTPRGLSLFLEIFTGVRPTILENHWPHPGIQVGVTSDVGMDTVLMRPVSMAHCFTVLLPLREEEVGLETIRRIHAIIQSERPVHTNYYLQFAPPEEAGEEARGVQVGVRSRVGVDTWVTGEEP